MEKPTNHTMKTVIKIHPMFSAWEKARASGFKYKNLIGKEWHIFSSEKGRISCVKFINYFMDGKNFYELYCLEGELFKYEERYPTFVKAKQRCKELLD